MFVPLGEVQGFPDPRNASGTILPKRQINNTVDNLDRAVDMMVFNRLILKFYL